MESRSQRGKIVTSTTSLLSLYLQFTQIKWDEVKTFDEVIAAGTAAALVPIRSLTMPSQGEHLVFQNDSEQPGPVISKLLAELKGIQQGKIKDPANWCHEVQDPSKWLEEFRAASSHEDTHGLNGSVDKYP